MNGLLVAVLLARLPCWPFEVEGQGGEADTAPVSPPVSGPAALPAPAPAGPPTSPPAVLPPAPVAGPASPTAPPSLARRAWREEARYDVRFGLLGSIGGLTLSLAEAPEGPAVLAIHAEGGGTLLGFGQLDRRLDAEFDLGSLRSRRWTLARTKAGQTIIDAVQRQPSGALALERRRAQGPPQKMTATFGPPTFDPIGLMLRLRLRPPVPGQPEILQALDGLALWRIRVWTAVLREPVPGQDRAGLRLEGEASPVTYDGRIDGDRPSRRFKLWLSDDPSRLPLRLEIPIGLGDVTIILADFRAAPPAGVRQPAVGVPGARSL